MANLFQKLYKSFLLSEGNASISSYIQSLHDALEALSPKTMGDMRRLEIAKENLLNIRRHVRKLEERVAILEEENNTLREKKIKK